MTQTEPAEGKDTEWATEDTEWATEDTEWATEDTEWATEDTTTHIMDGENKVKSSIDLSLINFHLFLNIMFE